jgi:hypothetical protein
MKLITNNPYRILGLLVGATAAQQNRQITRLRKYIEAEQEPEADFCFPSLGELDRTVDTIDSAASKLNLDADKMLASLFWFYNGNSITDEPAFDAIKDDDTEATIEIWRKLAINSESETFNPVTKRNASAFSNLSTLYLNQYGVDEETVQLKLLFIESVFFSDLVSKATDETYRITPKEAQLLFLNKLIQTEEIDTSEIIDAISDIEFIAKEEFLKGFVQTPIEQIEKLIEESRVQRKATKSNGLQIGKHLHTKTIESLDQLQSLLGGASIKYTSIADKVSDEILQCGIDYFNFHCEKEGSGLYNSLADNVLDIFNKAKSIAKGNIVKQRCKENTENVQDWKNDKPIREKHAKISTDLALLKDLIDEFEDDRSSTLDNAGSILSKSKNSLLNLKRELGSSDELYIIISTRIAGIAQGMCVSEINAIQEQIGRTIDRTVKVALILKLKNKVDQAWGIVQTIGEMDISSELRTHYTNNRSSLYSLKNQLADVKASSSTSSSSSNGCYIATMAYGDYDHPQVLVLRKFRDEKLSKSAFGRGFIKTYYRYSPMLVEKLKNYDYINRSIRKILNLIIKLIN